MTIAYSILTRKEIVYVGLASYSLYLWHWPVLSLSRWTIGVSVWTIPFLILAILLLSLMSYHFVEKPLRFRQWSRSTVGTLFSGLVLIGIGALALGAVIKYPFQDMTVKEAYLRPNWDLEFSGEYGGIKCNNFNKTDFGFSCAHESKAMPRAFFLGDSFNRQLLMMKLNLYRNQGLDIFSVPSNNCNDKPAFERDECRKQTGEAYSKTIDIIGSGDFILLSYYFQNDDRQSWVLNDQDYILFKDFANQASKKGAKVIVLSPLPQMTNLNGMHISTCLSTWRGRSDECRVKKGEVLGWHDATHKLLSELESGGLAYKYSAIESLCKGDYCNATNVEGFPIYSEDGFHLTDYAVDKIVYPDFLDFLGTLGIVAPNKPRSL